MDRKEAIYNIHEKEQEKMQYKYENGWQQIRKWMYELKEVKICMKKETVPGEWRLGVIILVPKKGFTRISVRATKGCMVLMYVKSHNKNIINIKKRLRTDIGEYQTDKVNLQV